MSKDKGKSSKRNIKKSRRQKQEDKWNGFK